MLQARQTEWREAEERRIASIPVIIIIIAITLSSLTSTHDRYHLDHRPNQRTLSDYLDIRISSGSIAHDHHPNQYLILSYQRIQTVHQEIVIFIIIILVIMIIILIKGP